MSGNALCYKIAHWNMYLGKQQNTNTNNTNKIPIPNANNKYNSKRKKSEV